MVYCIFPRKPVWSQKKNKRYSNAGSTNESFRNYCHRLIERDLLILLSSKTTLNKSDQLQQANLVNKLLKEIIPFETAIPNTPEFTAIANPLRLEISRLKIKVLGDSYPRFINQIKNSYLKRQLREKEALIKKQEKKYQKIHKENTQLVKRVQDLEIEQCFVKNN